MYSIYVNNGNYLILKQIAKITPNHMQLFFFCMNVKLPAQVLSGTTSTLLNPYYRHKTTGTINFCEYTNKVFACINVRSLNEGKFKINILCNPYEEVSNFRFN